jgi:glycosyltransferase involved in cell wall biosynthesis
MQPLLSIVVLVYNTAEYLPACFDSLLGQEYSPIEIIAIDDASTDNSLEICRAYEARHANFRCVSKPNEGGAVSGNLGIAMARGEYVALVDSDDLVMPAGYRLLMAEALATAADIVVGRAARLTGESISAVKFLYEPFVWSRRQVIASVSEFPDLMHDGFYWNKVFRLAFLREHRLGMVPGLLYADRPFVHRAYFLSQKTAIITDLVYLWRMRPLGVQQTSITQNKAVAANFNDRMRSVAIEWNDFAEVPEADQYRRLIAVTNLQRALHVVQSIVASPAFRQVFVAGMQRLLQLYGDLDYRALGVRRALYLELLKKGDIEGLCYLLALPVDGNIVELDGDCYWNQPFLDNRELDIAREVVRIDFPTIGFFRLCGLSLSGSQLWLELALHDAIMARCTVGFELLGVNGESSLPLQPLGRQRDHVYGFTLDLGLHTTQLNGLHGLILSYRCGDISGRYRIGGSLLIPAVLAALPMSSDNGAQLLYSLEAGGIAVLPATKS